MNFQDLTKVEKADFYLDLAFKNAIKETEMMKPSLKRLSYPEQNKKLAANKIAVMSRTISGNFNHIIRSFPDIDSLPEFYIELIRSQIDYVTLKKSLGSLEWAIEKVNFFSKVYGSKLKGDSDTKMVNAHMKEYYGRISSIIKRMNTYLEYLEESRKIMKSFPAIKTSMYTAAIFGFPNVGKTTLLSKLTGSKPAINSYAFTTTKINMGYLHMGNVKIQILDTPGTLDRATKMNPIEKQAYLAVKYCANAIVYVMDLTGEFPLDKQKEQLRKIEQTFSHSKKIIIYVSKTDITKKEDMLLLDKSKKYVENIEQLKKELLLLHNSN